MSQKEGFYRPMYANNFREISGNSEKETELERVHFSSQASVR